MRRRGGVREEVEEVVEVREEEENQAHDRSCTLLAKVCMQC